MEVEAPPESQLLADMRIPFRAVRQSRKDCSLHRLRRKGSQASGPASGLDRRLHGQQQAMSVHGILQGSPIVGLGDDVWDHAHNGNVGFVPVADGAALLVLFRAGLPRGRRARRGHVNQDLCGPERLQAVLRIGVIAGGPLAQFHWRPCFPPFQQVLANICTQVLGEKPQHLPPLLRAQKADQAGQLGRDVASALRAGKVSWQLSSL
mmetsp:Transcript_8707/g.17207  ORF Transcript_8707/g.17207 Transcript_8707/m.17207 type:complete len:207 (-) Transcript_8707:363-983(-)